MLVLSRKAGQSVIIDDRIRVRVARILGSRVKLTIDAPTQVPIDREEVWVNKQKAEAIPSGGSRLFIERSVCRSESCETRSDLQ